jgi:hypothetical protein
VTELIVRIIAFPALLIFVFVILRLIKPVSAGGSLARKLSIANAVGWLIILPLSTTGHPPPFLFPTILFWLINLILLPATAIALWVSHKEREERADFVAVASAYVAVNAVVLFVVPLIWATR